MEKKELKRYRVKNANLFSDHAQRMFTHGEEVTENQFAPNQCPDLVTAGFLEEIEEEGEEKPKAFTHVITAQDLELNPDLVTAGVTEGEEIEIAAEDQLEGEELAAAIKQYADTLTSGNEGTEEKKTTSRRTKKA